jgi:hypothetical protein
MQIAITTNNSTMIERREPSSPSFHALDVPPPYAPFRTPPRLDLAPYIQTDLHLPMVDSV